MTRFGYFLSSEEHPPAALLAQAIAAEEAGFDAVFISDHYHPWLDRQGESSFVWTVIGAIASRTHLSITTGVTCPTFRIHPAIIAQAASTAQELTEGRFRLGVGSGENLNEHILGSRWPAVDVRLEMLEEAVGIMRGLWEGTVFSHHGAHYTVENARIYSLPDEPPPILISGFGPKAIKLAARAGDGLITTHPVAEDVARYRADGGSEPAVGACKVCWGNDEIDALRTAFELWPTEALNGQLSQELPTPAHFEQVASVVTEDMVNETIPCGPDPERHLEVIRKYLDAGFDEVYVNQIGNDVQGFLKFFMNELRPRLN